MQIQPKDYYEGDTFERIKAFADTVETPCVVIDTKTFARQLDELMACFPYAKTYYAIKS